MFIAPFRPIDESFTAAGTLVGHSWQQLHRVEILLRPMQHEHVFLTPQRMVVVACC